MKKFLLLRHAQDGDLLTPELDQPLIPDSFSQIKRLAFVVKTMFPTETPITIIHGPSKRTSQTAEYLTELLVKSKYLVILEKNTNIKEFSQGRFRIDDSLLSDGKYQPLETAWKIFNDAILSGNVHYKFGDPIIDLEGKVAFPKLLDFFIEYGETQSDFLLRTRRFMFEVVNFKTGTNHLCVVVTHQAVASRIQREITGSRVTLGYCEGVFVPYPHLNRS